ncbi:MAG: ribonuclease HII [Nitrospinae bacterium]|nr:ribonuclease HII [Nitrospinota bacterium]
MKPKGDLLTYEREAIEGGFARIAGVDEAGRGPLAGNVVAGAVVLPVGLTIDGLTDSKQLSEAQRERLFDVIHAVAVAVGVGEATPQEIDRLNILQATRLAMRRAVDALGDAPGLLLIDGNKAIDWPGAQKTIVKGDAKSLSIAAASVIAKVTRDRQLYAMAEAYPAYGFDRHKGYPTRDHLAAIATHGPTPEHRMTFRGVRKDAPVQQGLI